MGHKKKSAARNVSNNSNSQRKEMPSNAEHASSSKKGGSEVNRDRDMPISSYRLFNHDEVPPWVANPFILSHYRAYFTRELCTRSLFRLHNETLNVWTHLFGFCLFIALFLIFVWPNMPSGFSLHFAIMFFQTIGALGCMACSAIYHLYSAHYSHAVCKRLHTLDFVGITLLTVFSAYPPIYYNFACHRVSQVAYLVMITVLGAAGLIGPLLERFHKHENFFGRLLLYVSIVASCLLPTVHTYAVLPAPTSNPVAGDIMRGIGQMFLLYGVGVLVYVSRFPERLMPGRFDVWFHSHQLWHMFVLAAAVTHFFTCIAVYQMWHVGRGHC